MRELFLACGGNLRSGEFADGEGRVALREQAALIPLDFHPRGISRDEVEAPATSEDIAKFEFPMEEAAAVGDFGYESEAREFFAEILDIDHTRGVIEIEIRLHLHGLAPDLNEERFKFALGGCFHRLRSHPEEHRHVHEKGIARGQEGSLLDRPEPQGAPVVHGELETAVG